jgi:uridine kinase
MAPLIIGVSGCSGCGKTGFCDKIKKAFPEDCIVISMDSYYKGPGDTPPDQFNFDDPSALDIEQLEKDIKSLKYGRETDIPIYDFTTHSRIGYTLVVPTKIIIIEGIFVFHCDPDLFDRKLYIDTDIDLSLIRRIRRDIAERGRDLVSILDQYERFVKPGFDNFILPKKRFADIIIPNNRNYNIALNAVITELQTTF